MERINLRQRTAVKAGDALVKVGGVLLAAGDLLDKVADALDERRERRAAKSAKYVGGIMLCDVPPFGYATGTKYPISVEEWRRACEGVNDHFPTEGYEDPESTVRVSEAEWARAKGAAKHFPTDGYERQKPPES